MTAYPLLSAIYSTERGDFETQYPTNLEPVGLETGISKGFLRSAMGASEWADGPGIDRGGINWNGTLYRVMGSRLVSFDHNGTLTDIGEVGNDGAPCRLDYGFGRLAIMSASALWYWDGTTLTEVTDPDLGPVYDMLWMDGYYVTTDGENIVVTDLADPTSVNPLKYGSAEADPDQIVGLGRLRGELYAFGSNTIETYNDAGTSGFPFQVSNGATIPIGCVGPFAKTPYIQSYAFVGGGRNQAMGVWLMGQGTASKLSTRAIDDLLAQEPDKEGITLESRVSRDENRLYVHLSDRSLVYLASASAMVGSPVWYICRSGVAMDQPYRLRNAVWAYDKFICGDLQTNKLGVISEDLDGGEGYAFMAWSLDSETFSQEKAITLGRAGQRYLRPQWRPHVRFSSAFISFRFRGTNGQPQFGDQTGWRFDIGLIYAQTRGAIIHDIELIGLPARRGIAMAACDLRIEPLAT